MKSRIKSFQHAFAGIYSAFRSEVNLRIHLVAAILVVLAAIYFEVTKGEWLILGICIGMVLSAEIFNASIERLADVVSPEKDDRIKQVKDLAAGAVLVVAIMAAILGGVVFYPYVIDLFSQLA